MKGTRSAFLLAALAAPGLAQACPQYDAAVAAVDAADLAAGAALYDRIVVEPACDDALRGWLASFLARGNFAIGMDAALPPETRRLAFETALGYEPHWRTWAAMGRLAWDGRDYTAAAHDLQFAINALVEGPPEHSATEGEIAEVYQLAAAAVALSDEVVAMPRTRSGEEGGLFATNIRGYEVSEVPLPITFVYATDDFDPAGEAYAQMLAEHLTTFAPASITLAGHTDPIGSDAYNLALSEDRADALAAYLRDHGYQGEITVTGLGRSQVPPPPPGIEPGSEEHYRIARRVTFAEE